MSRAQEPDKPKNQKPLSLYPLSFDQAVDRILAAKPEQKQSDKKTERGGPEQPEPQPEGQE